MRAILWLVSLTSGRCNEGNSVVGFTQLVVVVMRAILWLVSLNSGRCNDGNSMVGFTH